jgi:HD superfamily phosphohydrolase YqeK
MRSEGTLKRGDDHTLDLPDWAVVSDKRRAHIGRVVQLRESWADAMQLGSEERTAWRDAGRWHDALRDASPATLRALSRDDASPLELLHGPAAAERLRQEGERRDGVLLAIAAHTIGSPDWDRTGRALFMADYLEPGRAFAREEREFLASHVPHDFEGVFRQVLRQRLEWTLREGKTLFAATVQLWNEHR